MTLEVEGCVLKTRSLGKHLRFCDILVEKVSDKRNEEEEEEEEEEEKEKVQDQKELEGVSKATGIKCDTHIEIVMRSQDWMSEDPFPSQRRAILPGDKVQVQLPWMERVEGVNGKEDKRLFRCITASVIERGPEAPKTTWIPQQVDRGREAKTNNKRKRQELENSQVKPLCKHWIYEDGCDLANCEFRHYVLDDTEDARLERLRAQRAKVASVAKRESSEYHDGGHGDELQSKQMRACVFAEWLIKTFGVDTLAQGSGVLDVAGGKGFNSLKLLLGSKSRVLRTTVIDPYQRSTSLTKKQKKMLVREGCCLPEYIHLPFDEAFAEDHEELVSSASCIIGMHPDQATGSIVELAVKYRRPFAVVPCCVFANSFPDRQVGGKPVETINELVEWLRSHHANMQVGFLPMKGRNKVLYMKSEHFS